MTLRSDSYSTVSAVATMTRNLLDGQPTFNAQTTPTITEVEGFIDEVSGVLNIALRAAGFAPSAVRANSTAKLACDQWVRMQAVTYVETTQPYVGFDGQSQRPNMADFLKEIPESAVSFANSTMMLGFKREGVAVTDPASQGLSYTGLTVQTDRADPDDTSLEQPKFKRGLFGA